MPSPLAILLDPISLICLGIYAALMAWEFFFPARQLPRVPYWPLAGLASFAVYFYLSSYLPLWWDGTLAQYQLVDLSNLHTGWQFVIGLLVFECCVYWWHRAMHEFNPLWRVFHQMHHSAERLDTFGAFWFSPMDMIGFTFLGSVALVVIVGINAQAATAVLLTTLFLAIFQHANIRTPQWLGYLVQRPESHSYHHGMNIHRFNYSDLPLFDMLFGTFYNTPQALSTGFFPGSTYHVGDMLLFRDINEERLDIGDHYFHSDPTLIASSTSVED